MTDQQDQPQTKRPAMQVALDAEKLARQAMSEVENIGALAAAAAEPGGGEAGGGEQVGTVLGELKQTVDSHDGALREVITDLGATRREIGALATQRQVAKVREQVENIEKWQLAELEGAQDGGSTMVAGLVEMVAELREELEQLRGRL